MPPTQPSFCQKMKSAINPSQKTGVEIPTSAKPMDNRSVADRRRTAERTPIPTPSTSQMIAAPAIRSSVRGARCMISALNELPLA